MDGLVKRVQQGGLVPKNSTVILGLSGGPDSLTLLHILKELESPENLNIVPVHVNHQLRENADSEERHAADICRDWNLPCRVRRIDCRGIARAQKCSVEEAGRTARYRIFDEVAEELLQEGVPKECIRIALAHNADDQCETLLQRIVRGTGIRGLAGIPSTRRDEKGYAIVRPLLSTSRKEIEDYAAEHALRPNYDESNDSVEYTRNRIRRELIPYLEKYFNPGVKEALQSLAEIAGPEENYMEEQTRTALAALQREAPQDERILDADGLRTLHPAIIRRVVAQVIRECNGDENLRYTIVENVLNILKSENPSASVNLPGGWRAERRYEELVFRKAASDDEHAMEGRHHLRVQVLKKDSAAFEDVRNAQKEIVPCAVLDYDKLCREYPEPEKKLMLRTRKAGDRIGIAGGKHKKIQDYMVDRKIPKEYRDRLEMIAIGGEILWILPNSGIPNEVEQKKGRISQKYQIEEGSKAFLFLEITDCL